jgi:hypothetical protein
MRNLKTRKLSGILLTALAIAMPAFGSALYVSNADGLDTNDGSSWAAPFKTIAAATNAACFMADPGFVAAENGNWRLA